MSKLPDATCAEIRKEEIGKAIKIMKNRKPLDVDPSFKLLKAGEHNDNVLCIIFNMVL